MKTMFLWNNSRSWRLTWTFLPSPDYSTLHYDIHWLRGNGYCGPSDTFATIMFGFSIYVPLILGQLLVIVIILQFFQTSWCTHLGAGMLNYLPRHSAWCHFKEKLTTLLVYEQSKLKQVVGSASWYFIADALWMALYMTKWPFYNSLFLFASFFVVFECVHYRYMPFSKWAFPRLDSISVYISRPPHNVSNASFMWR